MAELADKVVPQRTFPELEIGRLKRTVESMREALVSEIEAAAKRRNQAKAKKGRKARQGQNPSLDTEPKKEHN